MDFLVGFWPLSLPRDLTDFSHFSPIEYMVSVLSILVVVVYPIKILFPPVGKTGEITFTILMQGLLILGVPVLDRHINCHFTDAGRLDGPLHLVSSA